MSRAFVSLYFVIVVSVLGVGWAMEQIWQSYIQGNEQAQISTAKQDLILSLVQMANGHDPDLLTDLAEDLSSTLSVGVRFLNWDDVAESNIKVRLGQGEIVSVNYSDIQSAYYTLVSNKESMKSEPNDESVVLVLVDDSIRDDNGWAYRAFVAGFYLLIAIIIYFWVLPLARDLKKLQQRAEQVGQDGEVEPLLLNQGSPVYSLSRSFNRMSARIRALLASQKEMTHGISHELRTPLARMKFTLATIEAQQCDPLWRSLDQNVRELETLISQFLNYASYEARNVQLQYQQGELLPMVQRVCDYLSLNASVEINSDLLTPSVVCDWDLIEHCLRNLLRNADRHCQSRVAIELWEDVSNYSIRVHDDGDGVAPDQREKIFEAFYRGNRQADSAMGESASEQSFGLGLALVRRIITWHHGTVDVKPSKLGGACFVLSWPKSIP